MRIHVDVVSATELEPEVVAPATVEPIEDPAPKNGADSGIESKPRTTTPRSGKKEKNHDR
jgi:hypothetical protein